MVDEEVLNFPIESFELKGVYGYKNLSMKMKGKTTIFVSENGSGKTTILNALNYLLKGQFSKLKNMSFTEIQIKLRGRNDVFIIDKDSIKDTPPELKNLITDKLGIVDDDFWDENETDDIYSAIDSYVFNGGVNIREDQVLNSIYNASMYQINDFIQSLKDLKSQLENLHSIQYGSLSELGGYLSGYEIIYLPTYRRVEKSFDRDVKFDPRRRAAMRKERRKYSNQDKISYGLRDVEETLSAITLDIERQSSAGYRSLSATMLDDLIRYENRIKQVDTYVLPAIEDLTRFLSCLDKPDNFNYHSVPSKEKINPLIKNLKDLYEKDTIKENHYLNYFLSKLNPIIQDTKEQESKIETFVAICNKYLKSAGDSKFLTFDQSKLEVIVYDEFSGEKIQLNDLSSGEKQVISLMSILYLYDNSNKIILIDEPELSLSLPWQKLLLPDVDQCNTVSQVIAITHSPFIFDNDLAPNATAMRVTKQLI
ncbi:AAA family ATPase [Enterobacter hormaechei]